MISCCARRNRSALLVPIALAFLTLALLGVLVFGALNVSERTARRAWLVAYVLVVNGGITMMGAHAFIAKWGFRGDDARVGLDHMIEGTASRPFVYRRLAPELVGAVANQVESRLSSAQLRAFADNSPLARYRVDGESWTPRKALRFHAAYTLLWLSLLSVSLAAAALVHAVRGGSWFQALLAGTLISALSPLTLVHGAYLYDAPELLLWTALLVFLIKGWYWATIPAFALMVVNKESALVALPAVAAFHWQRHGIAAAVKWTVPLAAIGIAWLAYVRHRYVSVAGAPMESWLPMNFRFWSNPAFFVRVGQYFAPGLPSPRGANLAVLVLLLLPFRFGWQSTPKELRWALAVTAAILIPLFFAASFMDEIRALALLFPLAFVVTVQGVHALMRPREGTGP